jgi:uncharacterized protein (TIGR02246 family)
MTTSANAQEGVMALLRAHDAAFAQGDARAYAALFCGDARLLLLHNQAIEGREAVEERWRSFFARYDTSAWATDPELVEVHGDHAYALSTYTETLVPRGVGPRISVDGRLVAFVRRESDGAWRIAVLMNSHTRPMEELT